jgi:signal transduction histidine kinase
MVALALSLRAVRFRQQLSPAVQDGLDEVAADLDEVLEEIRVFSQGPHPALLSRSGLAPALRELARRFPVPVSVDLHVPRLPESLEVALYTVSEASRRRPARY